MTCIISIFVKKIFSKNVPSMEEIIQELYQVVVNQEEQFSIWPLERPLPQGWVASGFKGTRESCLAHIDEIWVDMTPRSLRRST